MHDRAPQWCKIACINKLLNHSLTHYDYIFWIDADARILDVNEAACMTLGYSREELLSKTVHDIDPLFPAEAWPAHWAELKARKSFTLESAHTRKDGSIIQAEVTVNYLVHEGREYSCAFMRDVTARKEAYASLKAAYGRLQQMSRELQIVESNERSRLPGTRPRSCMSWVKELSPTSRTAGRAASREGGRHSRMRRRRDVNGVVQHGPCEGSGQDVLVR